MSNVVVLSGHLGKDAELRTFEKGNVMNVTLATSDGFGDRKKTNWHNLVIWNKEKLETHLKKGTRIEILGKISYREWLKDDVKKYITEIIVSEIGFGEAKKEENNAFAVPTDDEVNNNLPF